MRPTTFLLAALACFEATEAFKCAPGMHGSCTFRKSSSSTARCAIHCGTGGNCRCPSHYPNKKHWEYTGKHGCITIGQFDNRNQCQRANPNGK
ncbi:hypothetical protein PspLS_11569 [Pyricularia sp. CBS 133598]|nr:hypothetical protein PspLS_11569 [Pyricularia sp. CBS 133598]